MELHHEKDDRAECITGEYMYYCVASVPAL